jgi:hypothetical protein
MNRVEDSPVLLTLTLSSEKIVHQIPAYTQSSATTPNPHDQIFPTAILPGQMTSSLTPQVSKVDTLQPLGENSQGLTYPIRGKDEVQIHNEIN